MSTQANFNQIETMVATARSQFGVTGTPTFVINGQVANTNVWAGIEPLLRPGG
jgi:protein-disulfide isomerase